MTMIHMQVFEKFSHTQLFPYTLKESHMTLTVFISSLKYSAKQLNPFIFMFKYIYTSHITEIYTAKPLSCIPFILSLKVPRLPSVLVNCVDG